MEPFVPRLSLRGLKMPIYRETAEFDAWLAWQKELRATGRVAEADDNVRTQPLVTSKRGGVKTHTAIYNGIARKSAALVLTPMMRVA
jgi:hypothetical protein